MLARSGSAYCRSRAYLVVEALGALFTMNRLREFGRRELRQLSLYVGGHVEGLDVMVEAVVVVVRDQVRVETRGERLLT